MSTICKLNPKVREDRRMRAAMTRQVAQVRDRIAAEHGIGSMVADQANSVAAFLDQVRRSPYRTGARKNQLFQAIARELAGVRLAGQS